MSTKNAVIAGVTILVVLIVTIFGVQLASFNSTTNKLEQRHERLVNDRTALYDNMTKTIAQVANVAVVNDSSFQRATATVMEGRKSEAMFNWIQEQNPTASFGEVSRLYGEVARVIEAKRDEFYRKEQDIQVVTEQYNNMLITTYGQFMNFFFGKEKLEYKQITSTRTEQVMKSGIDDDITIFN